MSHPEEFNLDFVKFEQAPPPGIRPSIYYSQHGSYGWIWHQSDTDAEGHAGYWDTEAERDEEIAQHGGVLGFVLSGDAPTGDILNAMREAWVYVDPEYTDHLTLRINGNYFDVIVNDEDELVEKPKPREPRKAPRPAKGLRREAA